MTVSTHDGNLVADYAAHGSEGAFRAVVARHADLVFATALRQCGDRGVAEEVTQNVFVAMARKAPRLAGYSTLAGWLHRTAILEARARIRSELRRKRREVVAADLALAEEAGRDPLEAMEPLLDEGLLSLREGDRMALISRFFESKSLRDVGTALGVDEDAARKRVARALERLAEFFRRKGFAVSGAAGLAALFARGAEAAPFGLAAAAGTAGLGSAGAVGGVNLLILEIMTLSKMKTAVVCALLAAGPILWQRQAESALQTRESAAEAEWRSAAGKVAALEAKTKASGEAAARAERDRLAAEAGADRLRRQVEGQLPRPAYVWNDNSPLVRVPKSVLEGISVNAVSNRRGLLSEQIRQTLQMTDAEAERAQAAIDKFRADVQALQAGKTRRIEPSAGDLRGKQPGDVVMLETDLPKEDFRALREEMVGRFRDALGRERAAQLREGIGSWIPLADEEHGLSSSYAFLAGKHTVRFERPEPGQGWLSWGMSRGGSSINSSMMPDDVPEVFQPYVREFMDIATPPPANTAATPR